MRKKNRMIIGVLSVWALYSVTILASCDNPKNSAVKMHANSLPAYATTIEGLPIISFGTAEDEQLVRDVVLFLSPTCNFCNILYLQMREATKRGEFTFDKKEVSVVLFPRNEADYRIAKNLLCGGHRNLPYSYDFFQQLIYHEFRGGPIDAQRSIHISEQIAEKLGVDDQRRRHCESDIGFDKVLTFFHSLGVAVDSKGTVPLIVIDGKETGIQSFRALQRQLT